MFLIVFAQRDVLSTVPPRGTSGCYLRHRACRVGGFVPKGAPFESSASGPFWYVIAYMHSQEQTHQEILFQWDVSAVFYCDYAL